ncbi:hypothetical protein T4E_1037, partial [Trichinella pseudospiralis]
LVMKLASLHIKFMSLSKCCKFPMAELFSFNSTTTFFPIMQIKYGFSADFVSFILIFLAACDR